GALHGQRRLVRQTGRRQLERQVLRPMEVGRREVRRVSRRITVPAVAPIARGHGRERGVFEISAAQTVQGRGEARDRRGDDDTALSTDTAGPRERPPPPRAPPPGGEGPPEPDTPPPPLAP